MIGEVASVLVLTSANDIVGVQSFGKLNARSVCWERQPGSKRSYLAKGLSLYVVSSLLTGLALLVGIDGSRISECCGSFRVLFVSRLGILDE